MATVTEIVSLLSSTNSVVIASTAAVSAVALAAIMRLAYKWRSQSRADKILDELKKEYNEAKEAFNEANRNHNVIAMFRAHSRMLWLEGQIKSRSLER